MIFLTSSLLKLERCKSWIWKSQVWQQLYAVEQPKKQQVEPFLVSLGVFQFSNHHNSTFHHPQPEQRRRHSSQSTRYQRVDPKGQYLPSPLPGPLETTVERRVTLKTRPGPQTRKSCSRKTIVFAENSTNITWGRIKNPPDCLEKKQVLGANSSFQGG